MEATLSPIAETFAHLDPSEFGLKVNELWQGSEAVKNSIIQQVEAGTLTPLVGAGMVACVTGQAFGYAEFHRELRPSDLIGYSR